MKNIDFLSENFQFLVVTFSIYLNRRVFIMYETYVFLFVFFLFVFFFFFFFCFEQMLSLIIPSR